MKRFITLALALAGCGPQEAPPVGETFAAIEADSMAAPQLTDEEAQRAWDSGTSTMLVGDWRCAPLPTDQCVFQMQRGVWEGMTEEQKVGYAMRVGRAARVVSGVNYSKFVERGGTALANYSAFRDTVDLYTADPAAE